MSERFFKLFAQMLRIFIAMLLTLAAAGAQAE